VGGPEIALDVWVVVSMTLTGFAPTVKCQTRPDLDGFAFKPHGKLF
jgi:hypothetical protein